MTFCTFTRRDDGRWHCPECGYTTKRPSDKPPSKNCVKPLPLATRAVSLGKALVNFAADGATLVSADELAARLAACEPCENNRDGYCYGCAACLIAAKARMRSESCPMGKWLPVEPPRADSSDEITER